MTTRQLQVARGPITSGVVALAMTTALLTSSCAGNTSAASAKPVAGATTTSPAAGAPATSSAARAPASTPEVTETPTKITPRPADLLLGTYFPVKRNGKAPRPTITASRGSFTAPAKYSDGTTLQVTSIKQSVATGKGPGEFPGQPTTTLGVRLTNGSSRPINVSQVVVVAAYGNPKRLASPVYDVSASDFQGLAAPGTSVTATYVFSIPTARLGDVVMIVDLDGVHVSATFAGPAR